MEQNEIGFCTQLIHACDLLLEGKHEQAKQLLATIEAITDYQKERLNQLTKLSQSQNPQLQTQILACKAEEYLVRGNINFLQSQMKPAMDDLSVALAIPQGLNNAQRALAYLARGNVFLLQEHYPKAINDYTASLATPEGLNNNQKAIAYVGRALALAQLKQYKEAIEGYTTSLATPQALTNTYKLQAYVGRGNAQIQLQQYEQAVTDYNKALAIPEIQNIEHTNNPISEWLQDQLKALSVPKKLKDKHKTLAIPEGIDNGLIAEAYAGRGHANTQLKQYHQAIEDCSTALAIPLGLNNKFKVATYLSRGQAQVQLQQYKLAIEDFNRILRNRMATDVQQAEALYSRGNAQVQLKHYHTAIKDYSHVLRTNKLHSELKILTHLNRGHVFLLDEQYQLALKDYKEALDNTKQQQLSFLPKLTFCEYTALKASKRINSKNKAQKALNKFALDCSNKISALHIQQIKTGDKGKNLLEGLAANINQLLHDQCYFPPEPDQTLAHYTDLHCCQQLIKRKPFRMYHVRYMDDSLEGKHIWEHINLDDPDSSSSSHTFIGSFVQLAEDQSASEHSDVTDPNSQSATSGSSFREKMDMWRIYGQNQNRPASGCCFLFKPSDMPRNLLLITPQIPTSRKQTDSPPTKPQLAPAGLPYRFFNVLYRDFDELKQPDSPIKAIVDCLKNSEDPEYDFKQDRQVLEEVYRMLDQIRFLIKSNAYKHENEVRLIQFNVPEKNILLDDRLPPRFYIDVPAEFAPATIILGPRADGLEEWKALEQKHADGSQPISIKESQLEVRSR
ncbi:MAG: tetratricopeptide repeat protein [Gammaproteobacteria bacterium]